MLANSKSEHRTAALLRERKVDLLRLPMAWQPIFTMSIETFGHALQ